jgi:hypothetical protein
MKLSIDFGRWTTTKAAMAVAGALAIGGAVGSALAISPTVPAPVKWQGSVSPLWTQSSSFGKMYTVPAGRNLMITDFIISNANSTSSSASLYSDPDDTCSDIIQQNIKLFAVRVPANSTVVIPLVTGAGFAPGQSVCVRTSVEMTTNARGYLFTAAPAS